MTRRRGTIALPAALAALVVSAALGAALADLARIEIALARQRMVAADAIDTADACAADALAKIPPGWDFAELIVGADGRPGTADDGHLDARPECAARARPAPGPADPARVIIAIDARTPLGRHQLDLLVGRTVGPGIPALLWLAALPDAGAVRGTLDLAGSDAIDAVASVAAPVDAVALDDWLLGELPGIRLAPGTLSAITAPPPPLLVLDDHLRATGPSGAEVLKAIGPPSVALARVDGDFVVAGTLAGAGILFINGTLDIRGVFDFTGLVIASSGIRVESGASLTVRGALWIGAPSGPGPEFVIDGAARVARDRAALDAADRLLDLPRPAESLGLRDLG